MQPLMAWITVQVVERQQRYVPCQFLIADGLRRTELLAVLAQSKIQS